MRTALIRLPERVTYSMIQAYIEEKYGFKVHTAYIAEDFICGFLLIIYLKVLIC